MSYRPLFKVRFPEKCIEIMVAKFNLLGPVGDLCCFSNIFSMLVQFDFVKNIYLLIQLCIYSRIDLFNHLFIDLFKHLCI